MRTFCKTLFPVVEYAYSTIPTYPSGQIGYMLCSKNPVSALVILHLPSDVLLIALRLPANATGKLTRPFHQLPAGCFFLCVWLLLLKCSLFSKFRTQISRTQWKVFRKKKLKIWTLNITTLKFTERLSSSQSLQERYFLRFACGNLSCTNQSETCLLSSDSPTFISGSLWGVTSNNWQPF